MVKIFLFFSDFGFGYLREWPEFVSRGWYLVYRGWTVKRLNGETVKRGRENVGNFQIKVVAYLLKPPSSSQTTADEK